MNEEKLPNGWQWVRLGNISEINPRRPSDLKRGDNENTTFVPMAAVDELSGSILAAEQKPFSSVKKGYTYFEENDVLFAKITPCMQNGKHAIARNLIDGFGFGTTEFHVIRPTNAFIPEWIHLYLRQPRILELATIFFTGAVGQQRVPPEFLANLEIPLPSLTEQQRIVAIVEAQMAEIETARLAVQAQLNDTETLAETYLREVFESEEAKAWEVVDLGEVGKVVSGITLGRKLNEDTPTMKAPYLRVANVKDGYLDLSDVYEIQVTESEFNKWLLEYGDILLTEGGDPDKLGRGTFWENQIPDCIHQNHIFRVRFDLEKFSPEFLSMQLGSLYGKAYFLAHAKQTTGIATINQQVLKKFPLMIPPFHTQQQIAKTARLHLDKVSNAVNAFQKELDYINQLPSALLQQAFNGEL